MSTKKRSSKKTVQRKQKSPTVTTTRKAIQSLYSRISRYEKERTSIRGFSAADTSRLRSDWTRASQSTYDEIRQALDTLIARSRDAYNNNPYARAICNIIRANVICEGIKPTPRIKVFSDEAKNEEQNKWWSDAWNRIGDELDRTGKQTFGEMQNTILNAVIITGGALLNIVPSKKGSMCPIAFQVLDQSALDTTKDSFNFSSKKKGNQILHGIEFNEYLEPIAYHFKGAMGTSGQKVLAENIIHVYKRELPDQLVGVPWYAPVLGKLYDIEVITEDTITMSKIQASVALWAEKDEKAFPDEEDIDEDTDELILEPGAILRTKTKPEILQASDSISKVVEPLIKVILHSVAIARGFSYGLLTRDLNNSNFSASRANTAEDRRTFSTDIKWFSKDCCQKVREKVIKYTVAAGLAPISTALFDQKRWEYYQCSWMTNAWEYINPLQDVQSDALARQNGLLTDQEYFASNGVDYIKAYDQLAKEKQEREDRGLTPANVETINYGTEGD